MNEARRDELETASREAADSAVRTTPSDLARIAEVLTGSAAEGPLTIDDELAASSSQGVAADEGPIVAGLKVHWRQFTARHLADDGRDFVDIGFGLWTVIDDLGSLLRIATEDERRTGQRRMPYYGVVWPAGASLVNKMLGGPALKGQSILDLGCGLGECGFAAAALGAKVTFFDWEPRAIELVKASATRQEVPANRFTFIVGDWRQPPPRMGTFDLILGGDLLYEQGGSDAVAAFLAKHLKTGGEAWMTDPGRPQAWPFIGSAIDHGLELLRRESLQPQKGVPNVALLRVRRPLVGARSGIRGRI